MAKLSHVNMDKITAVKRGQFLEAKARAAYEAEAKILVMGPVWHQSLNITG